MVQRIRRTLKQFSASGILVLGSTLFALVCAELLLRLLGTPTGGVFTVSARQFSRVPGIFQPGLQAGVTTIPALEHEVTINALGYRGQDFPREKRDDEFRILFVGDSFAFGDFVDDDETLPAQLEDRLSEPCASARVVNMGLGGSTITEHVELLRRAYSLDPDLVVLLFSSNDVSDLRGPAMWEELARNREAKSTFPVSVVYPVIRGTALWQMLLRTRGKLRALSRAGPDPAGVARDGDGADPQAEKAKLRERYMRLLVEILEELDRREIPSLFAAFPSHLTVSGASPVEADAWIVEVTSELRIPTIELLTPLRESGLAVEQLYLLPHDGHPSPEGYGVAARAIANAVQGIPAFSQACSDP